MNAILLQLSIVIGTAAWAVIIWMNWAKLQSGGHKHIVSFLASIHVFRYVGLIALVKRALHKIKNELLNASRNGSNARKT